MSLFPYWLTLMTYPPRTRIRGGGAPESPTFATHNESPDSEILHSTMQHFDKHFPQGSESGHLVHDQVLEEYDKPPSSLLEESDPHDIRRARQQAEGHRLRLLEEGRQNMLSMDKQRKEALHRATQNLNVKMSTSMQPPCVPQVPTSTRQRNNGKGRQDGLASSQQPKDATSPSHPTIDILAKEADGEAQQQAYAARWTAPPAPPYKPPQRFSIVGTHQQQHIHDSGQMATVVKDQGHYPSHASPAPLEQWPPAESSPWIASADWRPRTVPPHSSTTPATSSLPTRAPLTRGMYGTKPSETPPAVVHTSPRLPLGILASSSGLLGSSSMPPPRTTISSPGASALSPTTYLPGTDQFQDIYRTMQVIDQSVDQTIDEITLHGLGEGESDVLRNIIMQRLEGHVARYQAWLQHELKLLEAFLRDNDLDE